MNLHDAETPPGGSSYRFTSGTTHTTMALPDALKNRYVTIDVHLQDVWVLFGATSSIEVSRSAAPTNGQTGATFSRRLKKDEPQGYRFWVAEFFTHLSVESSATAYVALTPSSRQDTVPSVRSKHT